MIDWGNRQNNLQARKHLPRLLVSGAAGQLGIDNRVLDVLVAEPVLDERKVSINPKSV